MPFLNNENAEEQVPRRETVLLRFNKKDSQIVRNWSKAAEKDMFDDKI
jgi:hypothetical protein